MAVTIKDVAKLANVAPSTVSRVIANNTRISEKTKRRVREAMEELGYHPNLNARSLANSSTKTLGLVMPSSAEKAFQNPFFPEVLRGISTKAHEEKYALLISTGVTEKEIYEAVVGMVQGRRVDGIVMLYSREDDQIIDYLLDVNFPFTVIGKPFQNEEEITYIDNDNYKAGKDATNYLLELGHERIGFIGGDISFMFTNDRLLGYKKALQQKGISLSSRYIVHEELTEEEMKKAIVYLMSLEDCPTALVVADDFVALKVLYILAELEISVPKDVSVISFNNLLLAEVSTPSLTSVDINIYKLGYEAADCLLKQLATSSKERKKITVEHQIIKRHSTDVH
ncbi:LacI family DNA-binding transcriptional regulator [Priestia endophytica]|uniref:LacI family DNA-binding transcriptional regulator n=1 Tax=Priestia endophytica TaxID=135735 RepID=UPI000DCA8277|nr:LacI family DNA-binding transcriptional regulator [Priestia endophytica]RAS75417.1 LacI family transcriptional regulator [Priestia endophytica]